VTTRLDSATAQRNLTVQNPVNHSDSFVKDTGKRKLIPVAECNNPPMAIDILIVAARATASLRTGYKGQAGVFALKPAKLR
jgi:hypothetical protein